MNSACRFQVPALRTFDQFLARNINLNWRDHWHEMPKRAAHLSANAAVGAEQAQRLAR